MAKFALTEEVSRFLDEHLPARARVAVGLSGGLDSVVLLDLLVEARTSRDFVLSAIHVHHGLSANADAWAEFCEQRCKQCAIPLRVERVSVERHSGLGLEAAARDARYAALRRADADYIALAHHADDQAETVLHQLLRGTGLQGLAGMGPKRTLGERQALIRPLLRATRQQIQAHAEQRGLSWIEDESNLDTALTRNFLRHDVLPLIAARFPHFRESLNRAARHAAEASALNEALARIDLGDPRLSDLHSAKVGDLDALGRARQCNALYWWLRWCGVPPPAQAQLDEWARVLFRASPTDKPHRAGGHDFVITRRRESLLLSRDQIDHFVRVDSELI